MVQFENGTVKLGNGENGTLLQHFRREADMFFRRSRPDKRSRPDPDFFVRDRTKICSVTFCYRFQIVPASCECLKLAYLKNTFMVIHHERHNSY